LANGPSGSAGTHFSFGSVGCFAVRYFGYLTLSISVALLFTAWSIGVGQEVTSQFLAFAAVCSLGFATLSGWLTGLVAQRAPIFHSGLLAVLLSVILATLRLVSVWLCCSRLGLLGWGRK
ncbi:MAG: hypothetical protein AAGL17_09620, partial [Cyanobacteria bacterium J06576_12]